ncbi:MAG: hypothetical protein V2I65_16950 [Paracoccaceae bacterium]|jgi:hypothetical protein|nr:hypothetical protein [Paracoccaceae bacterium]
MSKRRLRLPPVEPGLIEPEPPAGAPAVPVPRETSPGGARAASTFSPVLPE